jgi:multiple sugar transport system substrate-binding protein
VLRAGALLAGGLWVAGCDTGPAGGRSGGGDGGSLQVWDHYAPQKGIEEEVFAAFEASPGGMPVEHTVYNPAKMGEALQLAFSSNQMPDLHTLAGLAIPTRRLFDDGWFSPLDLPADTRLEGLTVFDGDLYSLTLFSFREYHALAWFNRDLLTKAGLDPEDPPVGYDDIRAAAAAMRKAGGDGVYGWIAPVQLKGRLADQVHQMAEAAGSPSSEGIDLRTGEYVLASQPYLDAIELWLAMKRDGLLFPGSTSLDARTGRARWATGAAGYFFDGCFNIGVVTKDFPQFADTMGVGPIPVPEPGRPVSVNRQPAGGSFWLSSKSQHAEAANALLSRFAAPEYMVKIAESMPSPPADLSAVDRADVHPTYRRAVDIFREQIFLAPSAIVANPAAALVKAEMQQPQPDFGSLLQGILTGDVDDPRAALQTLSDQLTAERERAIDKVSKGGVDVTLDAWAFPDWRPGRDFTQEDYA